MLGMTFNRLALCHYQLGDWEAADAAFREALACWSAIGHHSGYGIVQGNRATLAHVLGDEANAAELFVEALVIATRQRELAGIAENLAGVGMVTAAAGSAGVAAALFGAAESLRARAGIQSEIENDPVVAAAIGAARATLGGEAFSRRIAEGRALTIADANDLAIQAANDLGRIDTEPAGVQAAHSLSRREIEVLTMLAAGNNSRQIGAALFISPRTVTTHVQHIFEKLDVDSRAAAVSRAYQLGILERAERDSGL
jgi:DNA-binding CsgD family transcriptional regulator